METWRPAEAMEVGEFGGAKSPVPWIHSMPDREGG